MSLEIYTAPTPNPNAKKFILNQKVKNEGNSNYKSPLQCGSNQLAMELFAVRGVDQVHFFDNTVTITKFGYEDWEIISPLLIQVLEEKISSHDPDYEDFDPEKERRSQLSPQLLEIEEILDRTIRSGLQADGGDVQTVSYQDNILIVRYQGACGTCPSSSTGTLEAIKSILRDEFNPGIDVFIDPQW